MPGVIPVKGFGAHVGAPRPERSAEERPGYAGA
jgi:hypothetical protein